MKVKKRSTVGGVLAHLVNGRFAKLYVSVVALAFAYNLVEWCCGSELTLVKRVDFSEYVRKLFFPRLSALLIGFPIAYSCCAGKEKVRVRFTSPGRLQKSTSGAAAFDIGAAEELVILPGETVKVRTGMHIEMPAGMTALVVSRSGMAMSGLSVANSPGVVDSDFRGEVCVLIRNHGGSRYEVKYGERIAQLLFVREAEVNLVAAKKLSVTERGEGGFGSTGSSYSNEEWGFKSKRESRE